MPKRSGKNVFSMWINFGKFVYMPVSNLVYSNPPYSFGEKTHSYPTTNTQIFPDFHTVKKSYLPLVLGLFSPVSTTPTINYQKGKN